MILTHHIIKFWENTHNWVEPQSFDTLFKVVLAIYFIVTFVPDFVKYFSVSSLVRASKVRKYTFTMLEELITDFDTEATNKSLFLSTYSKLLLALDATFIEIEEKLNSVWKKFIITHLTVILISIIYLFFSAFSSHYVLVNKYIISILILFLLLPFFMSLYYAFKAIRPKIKIAKKYSRRIQEVSEAYRIGGTKGVLEQISEFAKEDLN